MKNDQGPEIMKVWVFILICWAIVMLFFGHHINGVI